MAVLTKEKWQQSGDWKVAQTIEVTNWISYNVLKWCYNKGIMWEIKTAIKFELMTKPGWNNKGKYQVLSSSAMVSIENQGAFQNCVPIFE